MDAPYPLGMMACIEEFFRTEATRRPGLPLYEDVFNAGLFFPLQRQRELAAMMRIAQEARPQVVMEIGADKGGGLYHWCKSQPTVKKVIACEIRGTPYWEQFQEAFPGINFLWIDGSSWSRITLASVERFLGGATIDCLFIDGDKSHFITDFDSYLPMMSPAGIVFLHDIRDPGPQDAYLEIVERGFSHEEIIDERDAQEALGRENRGIYATGPHEEWLRHWRGRSCGVGVIRLGAKGGRGKDAVRQ